MKEYHIEDFPKDKIRILLSENYRTEFWKSLKLIIGSDEKISKLVNYPHSVITKMRLGKNSRGTTYFLPLWMIFKFSKILTENDYKKFSIRNIEKHIIAFKTSSTSNIIKNPTLPLLEDERLVRVFMHLIGDGFGGRIYNRPDGTKFYIVPTYTNTNKKLIEEFVSDLRAFGNVPYHKRHGYTIRRKYWKILIPMAIKYIFEQIYNVELSASRGRLPKRFLKMSNKLKYQVIRAFCDDEGTIQDNGIVVSSSNKQQLEDLKILMLKAGFKEKFITDIKFGIRNTYNLKFYGDNFIFYGKFIGSRHSEKQDTLNFQINRHLKPRKITKEGETKGKLIKLLKSNSLTSLEIAKKLGISQTWTGAYLRELIRGGEAVKFYRGGKNKITYSYHNIKAVPPA